MKPTSVRRPSSRRTLSEHEIEDLLKLDVPARLATLDPDGFPRITPIWFLWDGANFRMTSVEGGLHLRNIAGAARAAICVDTEKSEAVNGVRHNRMIKARGSARISEDVNGEWTRRITRKYVKEAEGEKRAEIRASAPRILTTMRLESLKATGTPE